MTAVNVSLQSDFKKPLIGLSATWAAAMVVRVLGHRSLAEGMPRSGR